MSNSKSQSNSNGKNIQKSSHYPTVNPENKLEIKLQNPFTITVEMLSDSHIGRGAVRTGNIDSLVQKYQDGLPYIPAKTLTGIWRDACELVAQGLDGVQKNGAWQKWVDYLFGEQPSLAVKAIENSPRPAALSICAACLPQKLRTALKDKPQLQEALIFVKPGIQIELEFDCAKEEFLQFEEMVRGGTILEAKCELNLPADENQKRAAYALLIAGTQLVERLGGEQRRGVGKCQLAINEILNQDIKSCIQWLLNNQEPPAVPNLEESEAARTCTAFNIKDNQTAEASKLGEIEKCGVGKCQAKGYGQICFNDPLMLAKTLNMSDKNQENNNKSPDNSDKNLIFQNEFTFDCARIIETAAWRSAIRRGSLFLAENQQSRLTILAITIIEQSGKKLSKPTMSQLGALRSILTKLSAPGDAKVITWLERLSVTNNPLEKWNDGKKSLKTIRELLEKPALVWNYLAKALQELQSQDFSFSQITLTQQGEQHLKEQLWKEAVQILVDACICAHKRDLEAEVLNSIEEQEV